MTHWKKLNEKSRTFDDKKVVTIRTICKEVVQRKEEPLGRTNVIQPKKESSTAKKWFIGICIAIAIIFLMSVFL